MCRSINFAKSPAQEQLAFWKETRLHPNKILRNGLWSKGQLIWQRAPIPTFDPAGMKVIQTLLPQSSYHRWASSQMRPIKVKGCKPWEFWPGVYPVEFCPQNRVSDSWSLLGSREKLSDLALWPVIISVFSWLGHRSAANQYACLYKKWQEEITHRTAVSLGSWLITGLPCRGKQILQCAGHKPGSCACFWTGKIAHQTSHPIPHLPLWGVALSLACITQPLHLWKQSCNAR